MLYALVGALVIILDQWVKYWVSNSIPYNSVTQTFIPGVLSLVNIHNDGAAFSMLSGSGARIYFIILTGVFTVAVIIALASRFISGKIARWSIVLVTAGGLANCIDRIIYGYVQDMFKVELFNFAVFNVADIFITVFAIIFAIAMIFEKDSVFDDEDSALFEDDDETEDRPSRRRKEERAAAKAEKVAAKAEKADFAEMLAPKKPAVKRVKQTEENPVSEKTSRKERRAKYEEEYEQYKANRAARMANPAAAAAAAQQKAPAHNPADPFAEWEKANAKIAGEQRSTPAAKAAGLEPKPVKADVAVKEAVEAPAAVKESKPVSSDDFNLDDILSEFK